VRKGGQFGADSELKHLMGEHTQPYHRRRLSGRGEEGTTEEARREKPKLAQKETISVGGLGRGRGGVSVGGFGGTGGVCSGGKKRCGVFWGFTGGIQKRFRTGFGDWFDRRKKVPLRKGGGSSNIKTNWDRIKKISSKRERKKDVRELIHPNPIRRSEEGPLREQHLIGTILGNYHGYHEKRSLKTERSGGGE